MLWNTTTIADHERGLRIRNGRVMRWLDPGRHWLWLPRDGATYDRVIDLRHDFHVSTPEIESVLPEGVADVLVVGFDEIAMIAVDGIPTHWVEAGRYLLWQVRHEVKATRFSVAELATSIPQRLWDLACAHLTQIVVQPYERVVLFDGGMQADVLKPGHHGVHKQRRVVLPVKVDLREQELQITGQDVMTADKVSTRVNLMVRYRIVDPSLVLCGVANLHDALYGVSQLAARALIAGSTLDELLGGRNEAAEQMRATVAAEAKAWGVEIISLALKDVILPGDMKDILNQVIAAEKQAAANVILRREETAATRSLANTAKLLDQNPTMLRLKELESMERMASKVGEITVIAAPDQLVRALQLPG